VLGGLKKKPQVIDINFRKITTELGNLSRNN
jgi:hypothetical protein